MVPKGWRVVQGLLVLLALVPISCAPGGAENVMAASPPSPSAVRARTQAEYRLLAKNLALELKGERGELDRKKPMSEIIAEGHSAVMELQKIESEDKDVAYIAAAGLAGFSKSVEHLKALDALPRPADTLVLGAVSFLYAALGDFMSAAHVGRVAGDLQQSIDRHRASLAGAADEVEAAQYLLPKVAERFAAPLTDCNGRIRVDFDEAWADDESTDWASFENTGPAIEDVTLVVEIRGARGDVHKNVHYVAHWPAYSTLQARYEMGTEFQDRLLGNMTVWRVQSVDVTLLSPGLHTQVHYDYAGKEKDRDVAERCRSLDVEWNYQEHQDGWFWVFGKKDRGALLTLTKGPSLSECKVNLNFIAGDRNVGKNWELESWNRGEERTFTLPEEELPFDPSIIKMSISFPGTKYKKKFVLSNR